MGASRRTVAAAVAVVSMLGAVGWCGVRFGSELRATDRTLAATEHRRAELGTTLDRLRPVARAAGAEAQALASAVSAARVSVDDTATSLQVAEARLVLTGLDVYTLGACLGGVTRALDQVSVGQTGPASSSMAGVSTSCSAGGHG